LRRWTEGEDGVLRKGGTVAAFAVALGRTEKSVRHRLLKLGLLKTNPSAPWTKVELMKLRHLAGHVSVSSAPQYFKNRTRSAIIQKSHELKLDWKGRRVHVSAFRAAESLAIGTVRLHAVARRVGIEPQRYGGGSRVRWAFTEDDIARIEMGLFEIDTEELDFELYRCPLCNAPLVKPWGWRRRRDAYRCGHRPKCHACRMKERSDRGRSPVSIALSKTTRLARKALAEFEGLFAETPPALMP
jgi:hypothetical protein